MRDLRESKQFQEFSEGHIRLLIKPENRVRLLNLNKDIRIMAKVRWVKARASVAGLSSGGYKNIITQEDGSLACLFW